MKPLLVLLIAALIALSGTSVVFAEEQPDSVPVTNGTSVQGDGQIGSDEPQLSTTQPVLSFLSAGKADASETAKTEKAKKKVIKGEFKSKDKCFKLYIYDNGKLAYADIIKYIGEDDFPENYKISKIDGYKIRKIRSKAFSKLKTLKKVTFRGSVISDKHISSVAKEAFYNCKNLSAFSTSSFVTMNKKSVGYVNDKLSKNFEKLIINDKTLTKKDVSSKLSLADGLEAKAIVNISENNTDNRKAELVDYLNGSVFYTKLGGKSVKGWKSSKPEVISITDNGKAVVLTKGKTTLSVKKGKLKVKRVFSVSDNPYLSVKDKKVTSVKIKNGETQTIDIVGKAAGYDNEYNDNEYATIDAYANSDAITIKAERVGKTSIGVMVNGKILTLDVKVLKNPIQDDKMERIASKVGNQAQYYYSDSSVMCSAYAYAYTYYQVTGRRITPGSVWCPGGCTWAGGINNYYGTKAGMLKAIKQSLDKNESCVGLVAVGNSNHHYVTFYDYNGKGKQLDDFKIVDPWYGNLTTGEGYRYSYDYQVVTVDDTYL